MPLCRKPPVVEGAQRNGGHGAELRGTDQRKVLRNVEQGGVGDRGESGGESPAKHQGPLPVSTDHLERGATHRPGSSRGERRRVTERGGGEEGSEGGEGAGETPRGEWRKRPAEPGRQQEKDAGRERGDDDERGS